MLLFIPILPPDFTSKILFSLWFLNCNKLSSILSPPVTLIPTPFPELCPVIPYFISSGYSILWVAPPRKLVIPTAPDIPKLLAKITELPTDNLLVNLTSPETSIVPSTSKTWVGVLPIPKFPDESNITLFWLLIAKFKFLPVLEFIVVVPSSSCFKAYAVAESW